MNTSDLPHSEQPKQTKFVSPWLAYPLALFVWWVLPWAVSWLTPHYRWAAGQPSLWNLLGLMPVLIGTLGLIWGIAAHTAQSARGIEWELDKSYLLRQGLYAFSRNPMYVSELILLLGWIIFFGSVALVIASLIWLLFFSYYQVPLEERVLEAHFGEAYRQYKSKVPRWFGRIHHSEIEK